MLARVPLATDSSGEASLDMIDELLRQRSTGARVFVDCTPSDAVGAMHHRLLSAGADLKVRVWPTEAGDLVSAICGSVSRFLSPGEWEEYLPQDIEYERYEDTYRRICLTEP